MTIADDIRPAVTPRYVQLADELKERIAAGIYPLASQLPTEAELCKEFELSRHTVREALRRLSEAGFLRRRQGSGSQVIAAKPTGNYVHSMRSLSELTQYAADTRLYIHGVAMAVPDPQYAADIGEGAEAKWLTVEGVRKDYTNDAPICWSVVFINAEYAAIADELPGHSGAIYGMLEQRFGVMVADVEQEIRTQPMPPVAAKALKSANRVWAVRIVRRYLGSDGKLLLASVNYHAGDRFSYSIHLKRDQFRGREINTAG